MSAISTVNELVRATKRLRKAPDRPKGFHTVEEMAWALLGDDDPSRFFAYKSRVDRLLKVLDHEKRLEKIDVVGQGPTGRRGTCTAFKILPEGK